MEEKRRKKKAMKGFDKWDENKSKSKKIKETPYNGRQREDKC